MEPDLHEAMGFFLAQWIAFERAIRERVSRRAGESLSTAVPMFRLLDASRVLDKDTGREVELIRRIRNNVVHGVEIPDATTLREAGERLQVITERINQEE